MFKDQDLSRAVEELDTKSMFVVLEELIKKNSLPAVEIKVGAAQNLRCYYQSVSDIFNCLPHQLSELYHSTN